MDAQYLDPLDVRVIADNAGRPRWEVLREFRFYSAVLDRDVAVLPGFETDGPSVPVALASMIGAQSVGFRAAVIHDWLLQTSGTTRQQADRVFLEALRCCGCDETVARMMYHAVSLHTATLEGRQYDLPPGMSA